MVRRFAFVLLLAACPRAAQTPAPAPSEPPEPVDFAQAEAMLIVLQSEAPTPAEIDAVMVTPGTELIVKQQNLSRRITAEQYKAVLSAITAEAAPDLAPADPSERAERGVRGLRDDVWPALRWGRANAKVVGERVAATRALDPGAQARKLAVEWLPDKQAPAVRLHVVLGGRAGAAAIDNAIYFDALATSFKASVGGEPYPEPAGIVAYFAHEAHHVGLAPIIGNTRARLALSPADRRAFDLLAMLVSEGSATYFINAHHELDRMRRDPQYAEHLADVDRTLAAFERILADVTAHGLDGDALDKVLTPFVASGFHAAGAVMLDAIYRRAGRSAVDAVLRDPRQLLAKYNAAAVALVAVGETARPFDNALVERLARLGE